MESQPLTSKSDPTMVFGGDKLPRTSGLASDELETDTKVRNVDDINGQYNNLSENYTKLKTTFSGEKMEVELEQCEKMNSSTNDFSQGNADDIQKKRSIGEEDENVLSLLSVHFGGKDESEKGGQKLDKILGKLHDKKGIGETSQIVQESGENAIEGDPSMATETGFSVLSGEGNPNSQTGSVMWKTADPAAARGENPPTLINPNFSRFPRVRRQRQRPPPKTSTVYNAELTTIATADQICLNIRLKERKEKHERWKKFPNEKTKYRTKSTRKAEADAKKKKDKEDGKVKKKKQKQQEKQDKNSVPASSSNNTNPSGAEAEFAYQCQYCGMGFAHNSRLKLHERCHTGEKPYPCPFCDKAFSQNGYLKTHLKIHTGEKPFRCSICDYSFRLSTTLNRHMRVHTGECPYTCHVCDRSFNQKSTLSKHIKVHSEDRPHVCSVCNKGFRLIDTLRVHQQIHDEVRSFICSVCDKAFKTKGTLLSHMKTHTRNLPNEGEVYDDFVYGNPAMMHQADVKGKSSYDNTLMVAQDLMREDSKDHTDTKVAHMQNQSFNSKTTGQETALIKKEPDDMD